MAEDLDDVTAPDDLEDDVLGIDAVEVGEALDDEVLDDEVLDDVVLDDEVLDGTVLDDEVLDDADLEDDGLVVAGSGAVDPALALPAVGGGTEETEDEEDDEEDDEDVEASLDVILKERLVVEEGPEDDEILDADDRSEVTDRVLPKQPDEFVCRSCFLVKHPSQLADKKKMLCRDCV